MASLSDDRVQRLLMHGTRTGKVAWVASDGAPHVAPIWFVIDGDEIVFNTGADRAEEFGRRNGVPGELLVRLHPTKITAAFDVAD